MTYVPAPGYRTTPVAIVYFEVTVKAKTEDQARQIMRVLSEEFTEWDVEWHAEPDVGCTEYHISLAGPWLAQLQRFVGLIAPFDAFANDVPSAEGTPKQ